jgi:hypothetical protein
LGLLRATLALVCCDLLLEGVMSLSLAGQIGLDFALELPEGLEDRGYLPGLVMEALL